MFSFLPLLAGTTIVSTTETTTTETTVTEVTGAVAGIMDKIDISKAQEIMNPTVWSTASIEGIIILVLIVFAIYKLFHRAYKFAWWCIGAIFMIQILYLLGLSSVNDVIPLHSIFKYDIGTSIAQLFVGTKIAPWILYINEMLKYGIIHAGNFFINAVSKIWSVIKNAIMNTHPEFF